MVGVAVSTWSCALGDYVYRCPYQYSQAVGCGKNGKTLFDTLLDSETVEATDPTTACLAVSEIIHFEKPQRLPIICDPDHCESLGPVQPSKFASPPQPKPQGFDAGAAPPIVCDGGTGGAGGGGTSVCDAFLTALPGQLAITPCARCFATLCCAKYEAGIDAPDSTGIEQAETRAEASCWLDTLAMPACPPQPLGPNAGEFVACMATACAGSCAIPMRRTRDAGSP